MFFLLLIIVKTEHSYGDELLIVIEIISNFVPKEITQGRVSTQISRAASGPLLTHQKNGSALFQTDRQI